MTSTPIAPPSAPHPSGQRGRTGSEALRVARAELRRQFRIAPRSTWMAAVVFPFLTIWVLYALPRLKAPQNLQLFHAAYSIQRVEEVPGSGSTEGRGQEVPPDLAAWIEALKGQPYFALHASNDARRAFEEGAVELAVLMAPERSETTQPASDGVARTAGSEPEARWTLTVLRHHDFFSSLFVDHVQRLEREGTGHPRARDTQSDKPSGNSILRTSDRMTRLRQDKDSEGRAGLLQTAPFLLLGFAWFFLTVGATEGFVVEREKRTLEPLLSTPVSREGLAWGRILSSVVQAAMPMCSASLAFVSIGLSPWIFSVVILLVLLSVPVGALLFWLFRDLEQAMVAGWRTGGVFMVGFPLLILADDLVGTLSPLYPVSRALEQAPPAVFLLSWGGVALGLILTCIPLVRRVARDWTV